MCCVPLFCTKKKVISNDDVFSRGARYDGGRKSAQVQNTGSANEDNDWGKKLGVGEKSWIFGGWKGTAAALCCAG